MENGRTTLEKIYETVNSIHGRIQKLGAHSWRDSAPAYFMAFLAIILAFITLMLGFEVKRSAEERAYEAAMDFLNGDKISRFSELSKKLENLQKEARELEIMSESVKEIYMNLLVPTPNFPMNILAFRERLDIAGEDVGGCKDLVENIDVVLRGAPGTGDENWKTSILSDRVLGFHHYCNEEFEDAYDFFKLVSERTNDVSSTYGVDSAYTRLINCESRLFMAVSKIHNVTFYKNYKDESYAGEGNYSKRRLGDIVGILDGIEGGECGGGSAEEIVYGKFIVESSRIYKIIPNCDLKALPAEKRSCLVEGYDKIHAILEHSIVTLRMYEISALAAAEMVSILSEISEIDLGSRSPSNNRDVLDSLRRTAEFGYFNFSEKISNTSELNFNRRAVAIKSRQTIAGSQAHSIIGVAKLLRGMDEEYIRSEGLLGQICSMSGILVSNFGDVGLSLDSNLSSESLMSINDSIDSLKRFRSEYSCPDYGGRS